MGVVGGEREHEGEGEGEDEEEEGKSNRRPPGDVSACNLEEGVIALFCELSVQAPVLSIRPVTIFKIS